MPTPCVPNARMRCEPSSSNLNQEIVRWTQEQVFAIARKTLADLADAGLEERMSEVFVARLRGMTGPAKDQLAAALKKPPRHGDGSQRVRPAAGAAGGDRERGQGDLRAGSAGPVPDGARS